MFNRSMSLPNSDVDRGLNYCDNFSPVQVRQCHQLVKYLHVGTSNMSIDLSDFCKRLLLIEEKKNLMAYSWRILEISAIGSKPKKSIFKRVTLIFDKEKILSFSNLNRILMEEF